jgi:phage terminase small subunit
MGLTAKQERFAREFLLDGNAARAAVAAGYAKNRGKQTGAELLRNDGVRALIAELGKAKAAELDLSHDYVIEGFLHYDQGAREGRYPGSVGVRALEALAKSLGMFVERRETESRRVVVHVNLDRRDTIDV